jgi:Zn-dependent M28 family amino/carboxypeptidase
MELRMSLLFFFPLLLLSFLFLLEGDERTHPLSRGISMENLKGHVVNLQFDRDPNDHFPALERAAHYIYTEFSKVGLKVSKETFQWEGKRFSNIIAEKTGFRSPDEVLILGAHYDTVPGSPGADDNASGIAVLLEVARNIQAAPLASTVRFIAFCLEECDFIGSTDYVKALKKGKEKILGMISLEMVGFTSPQQNYPPYLDPKYYPNVGDFIAIVGNERSKELLEKVCRFFRISVPQLPMESLCVPGNGEGMEEIRLSDHSSFWDQNLMALMVTDTAFLRNPNYHLASDTKETLDFEFMQKVAIGISHSIVELAK